MTFAAAHPDLERRAKAAFDELVDLPPDDRVRAMARLCGNDDSLRTRVASLLAAHDAAENFLDPPPPLFGFDLEGAARGKPTTDGDDPLIGQHIARYRILRRLGTGGMGVVYLAQQDQPARQVALKIMRAGLASRSMLRRFEHEAEVLGQLRHAGIAQIFEAGTFDSGLGAQPFFAMEFIDGRTLTDYAKTHELSTRDRLELLAQVCDAVHHAHQKGVVHRDLKPDNVLVEEPRQAAPPRPKILDFGVARLTDSDLAVSTLKTDLGQIVGTLPYMSPEQIAGDASQVDIRSDVYALGVIGFELLTGELPLNVKHKSVVEAARIISDHEAPSLTSFNRVYRGDISTIIAKALEKNRGRRYQSASDLGADIRRYLRSEPISARPATTLYHLQKFARRNKPLVAGVLGVLLMLVLGIIGTSVGLVQARQSARIAKQQQAAAEKSEGIANEQRQAAQASARDAELQREAALQVSRFLQQMLASINPSYAQGRDTSLLRAILDNASQRVERELEGQPDIAATLHGVIGRTYASIAEYGPAVEHLQKALDLRQRMFPPDANEIIQSLGDLGRAMASESRYIDALPMLTEALDIAQRSGNKDASLVIRAMIDLGNLKRQRGDYRGAHTLLEDAANLAEASLDADDTLRLAAMNDFGIVLLARQRFTEALPLFQRVVAARERLNGPDSIELAIAEGNLARVLTEMRDAAALAHAERALAICRKVLPPGHDRLVSAMQAVGSVLYRNGDYERAEALANEALKICREVFGEDHPNVASALANLANVLEARQNKAEAEKLCVEALEMRRRTLPTDHRDVAASLRQLAGLRNDRNPPTESRELLREALRIQRLHGDNDYDACETQLNLGVYEYRYGEIAKAEELVRGAANMMEDLLGDAHPAVVSAWSRLALMLEEQDKFDEALALRRRVMDFRLKRPDADNEIAEAQRRVGHDLCALARYAEAEPILREALQRAERFFGTDHMGTARAQSTLGKCLVHLDQLSEAEQLLLKSDRLWGERYPSSPQSTETRESLVALYGRMNRPDEVAKWQAILKSRKPASTATN